MRYAIGAVANESNRTWAGGRQSYVQYDPIVEHPIGIDAETGQYIPRVAKRWEISPDLSEWTFFLNEGIPFHNDWGELTSKDVKHTLSFMLREDSRLSTGRFYAGPKRKVPIDDVFEIIDDHTFKIVFHGPGNVPTTTSFGDFLMSNASSEMGVWSKDFWDAEGEAGLDAKGLQGSGSYQYLGREPAQSIIFERAPQPHWNGETPEFEEVEIFWVIEDASRYAAVRAGEAHIADLPLDLQKDAEKRGLKLIRSRFTANNLFIFFGGLWFSSIPRDKENFDSTVPWTDIRVREAMNKAINREELLQELYQGIGELMYVGNAHPTLEGWDDTWPERYKTKYKYNPEEATRLLAEAGYGPDNPIKVNAMSYVSPGESELPQVLEAVCIYWERVNVNCEIEDMDGAAVAKRYRNYENAHSVWPNIIIYFPVEYWENAIHGDRNRSQPYRDDWIVENVNKLRGTTNAGERDKLAREILNYDFENYVDMPLFWFRHTVVVDPKVVSDWVYPGNAVPRASHLWRVKAAR
ncbi:MAG: ABC transporter substrate-binding protein [Dehalococcoidia bacterium]